MKKIFKIVAIVLVTICSFGLFARITTNANLFEKKKKAETEIEQEQTQEQANKYKAGAKLQFNNDVVFSALSGSNSFQFNIVFTSRYSGNNTVVYENLYLMKDPGLHISSLDRNYSPTDFYRDEAWAVMADVWELKEDIPDTEEYAILRAFLDDNVIVS